MFSIQYLVDLFVIPYIFNIQWNKKTFLTGPMCKTSIHKTFTDVVVLHSVSNDTVLFTWFISCLRYSVV